MATPRARRGVHLFRRQSLALLLVPILVQIPMAAPAQAKPPAPTAPAARTQAGAPQAKASAKRAKAPCAPTAPNTHCETFSYTGADQTWRVPAGVTSITLTLRGAGGGGTNGASGANVTGATRTVVPNQIMRVVVGGAGSLGGGATYGGGGAGGTGSRFNGGSGGGMSGVFNSSTGGNPLAIAGGGGGGAAGGSGGGSGGPVGNAGAGPTNGGGTGAGGGTATAGGAPATSTNNCPTAPTAGSQYTGGRGGSGGADAGGGGGGGYYGGGGGQCQQDTMGNNSDTGGGGGSSYIVGGGTASSAGAAAGTNGTVTIQWTETVDLSVTKTASPSPYVPGRPLIYTITVNNAGPTASPATAIRDTFPTGLTGVTWTCAAAGTGTTCGTAAGTGNLNTTANLGVNGRVTYSVQGTAASNLTTPLTNTATVTKPTNKADAGCNPTCSGAVTTAAAPSADIVTTKAPSAGPVAPGETFDYTLTVRNNGPSDAQAVQATDTLPDGLTFVSGAGCSAAGQVVTCGPPAAVAANASKVWTFTVRLAASYTGDGSDLKNIASATTTTPDPDPDNNTTPPVDPPPIVPKADVKVTKVSRDTGPIVPGTEFNYTITVTNDGPSDAQEVKVTDKLPTQLSFVSSAEGCTGTVGAYGGDVTCPDVATLAAGATQEYTFRVKINPSYVGDGSDIENTASVTSSTPDPNLPNNTSPPAGPPSGVAPPVSDLDTTKTSSAGPVSPGETFDYTVTVKNKGPSDALNAKATDTLPAGLSFVSGAGCSAAGQVVTCGSEPSLAAGASKAWTFTVRLIPSYLGDGTDLKNTATGNSDSTDPDLTDNTSPPVDPPAIKAKADLVTAKDPVGDTKPIPGTTFQFKVTTTNNGPADAQNVKVTDQLPAELELVSSEPAGCTPVNTYGAKLTCPTIPTLAAGASTVTLLNVRLKSTYVGSGTEIKNIAISESDTEDPDPGNNPSPPAGLPGGGAGLPMTDLAVTKKPSTDKPVTAGETFDYIVVGTNNGPSAGAVNMQVTDPLPPELIYVSTLGQLPGETAPKPVDCALVGRTVTCPKVPLVLPTETITYTIKVKVDPDYTGDGTAITNVALVTADNADPDDTNNKATAGVPGGKLNPPSADLHTDKRPLGDKPVVPGDTFDYELSVTNKGPSTAVNVTQGDPLPAPLAFVSSKDGCTGPTTYGGTVTCATLPKVAPGQTVRRVFTVRLNPRYTGNGSDIANVSTAKSETKDPYEPDNTGPKPPAGLPGVDCGHPAQRRARAGVCPPAAPSADLELRKRSVLPKGKLTPDKPFDYVLTVINHGTSSAVDATTTDPLPNQVMFAGSSSGCTAVGQLVTCPVIAVIDPGETRDFIITVRTKPTYKGNGSDIQNRATVRSPTPDPDLGNNSNLIDSDLGLSVEQPFKVIGPKGPTGGKPTFTGIGTAGSKIRITDSKGRVVCTTKVKSNGTWACPIKKKGLKPGKHCFNVEQINARGKVTDRKKVCFKVLTEKGILKKKHKKKHKKN